MKKRNKNYLKEKEFIRLNHQLAKNYEDQSNLGWLEIPPIFIGYDCYLVPRKDIQNREDAWVFWYISQNFSSTYFAKKIEKFSWNREKSHWPRYNRPEIRTIKESVYCNLSPQIKKWFVEDFNYSGGWNYSKLYRCNVPSFYFELFYSKSYQTRVKIYSSILEQEADEISTRLHNEFFTESIRKNRKAPRYFRNMLNRRQRYKSKRVIKNFLYNDKDEIYEDNFRGADWLWD